MAAEEDQALADEPVDRVRAVLERIVDELDVDGSVEVSEEDDEIIGRVDGRGPRPPDRPPRPDDRRRAASLLPGGLPGAPGPQAGHGRCCRLPGAPSRCRGAPGRPRSRAGAEVGQGNRARADDPDRAARRAPAPEGTRRDRDLQRGRRARALRRSSPRCSAIDQPHRGPRRPRPLDAGCPRGHRRAGLGRSLRAEQRPRPRGCVARPRRRLPERPRGRGAAGAPVRSPTSGRGQGFPDCRSRPRCRPRGST